MSDMLPLATYTLNVEPYDPTPAIGMDMPVTIRLTMAALDPEPFDDEKKPSTLRMIKRNPDYDLYDYEDSEDEESEESEESEEEQQQKKGKKGKKAAKKAEEESEDEEVAEEDEDEDEVDDEFQECVLATLSPESGFQQTLDITIAPEEDVQFVVTGSYTISLSGNYIKHPFDTPIEGLDSDEEDEGDYDEDDEDINDLIDDADEDDEEIADMDEEQLSDELDDLEEASDIEGRIEELVAEEEAQAAAAAAADKKSKKQNNKRKQEQEEEQKNKKAKKVEFKKGLEEGPTKKAQQQQKPKAKTLAGGIVVEDRVTGKGGLAKKGSRIGMRYIGKLKNGKVFDKNTSGKPFTFKLGQGEVIKGWDIGVAGMAVGGERRIVIPAPYAYGKQALPGIPANSELTFDVKLVSMK